MSINLTIILAVLFISLLSLAGVAVVSIGVGRMRQLTSILVSLAVGTLLGNVFIHILPEVTQMYAQESLFAMLTGILGFFALEHFFHWHHEHQPHDHHDHTTGVAYANLFADGLHNFIDGLIIAAAFLVTPSLGFATVVAVAFHEIPQELADFGILIDAGFSRKKALIANLLSALTAVLGAVVVILWGEVSTYTIHLLLAFAGGGFIYIAVADLLPKVYVRQQPVRTIVQFGVVVLGILIMYALTLIE